jgi:hypothetical protein
MACGASGGSLFLHPLKWENDGVILERFSSLAMNVFCLLFAPVRIYEHIIEVYILNMYLR